YSLARDLPSFPTRRSSDLSQHSRAVSGSCVLATLEGTRPLLVEIQALVDAAHAPNPRRLSVGLEQNRLAMLLAVLHRHAGVATRSEEHTSELQSLAYLVCR